jgi:hypothetical protein
MGARLRPPVGTPLKVEESGDLGVCLDDYVTARSATSTQRLAARTTPNAFEGDDSGTTIAGTKMNGDLVDEHGSPEPRSIRSRGR